MRLSVVIPCLNGAETLPEQLAALAAQSWDQPWEVVVADNGSTDGSVAVVRGFADRLPGLRIIDASARRGQPFALNTGAAAARGELLAFCDADDRVGAGWVAAMGAALETADMAAGRMEFGLLNDGWVARARPPSQTDSLQPYRRPDFLPHGGGGNLAVRRAVFERVGGFDETLPLLHDTDLCWRVQLAGGSLVFAPDAVLHVRLRADLGAIYRQARGYAEWNVVLHKRYRHRGMGPRHPVLGLAAWLALPLRLATVRDRGSLGAWLWALGWRVGRLRGSVRQRILSL